MGTIKGKMRLPMKTPTLLRRNGIRPSESPSSSSIGEVATEHTRSFRAGPRWRLGQAAMRDNYYAEARRLLAEALAIYPKTFFEFKIAKAELNRLNR